MGTTVVATIVVLVLTIQAVKKRWNPIAVAVLFTTLFSLLGLNKQVTEAINNTSKSVSPEALYGITSTNVGLAVLTGFLAWLLRTKSRALFIMLLVATLTLLNFDVILSDAILGPITTKVIQAWDWFYPWVKDGLNNVHL